MRKHSTYFGLHIGFAWALVLSAACTPAAEPAPPLRVLFLGDPGAHQPALRAAQLAPILASRGIEVVYTERVADLNARNLTQYDTLLLYANIDKIDRPEAQALLDYVAAGGGFVPVHCASYCFRNNPEVVALIGGQFLKHGAGEFATNNVAADHPILRGLRPFRTWDETYQHQLHNAQDRTVLQTRSEGTDEEPWTWVRTHGKGRVFYTAYGHDYRTWSQPGFQALLERGIRWAANKGEVFDSVPRMRNEVAAFEYAEVKSGLPNYKQGAKWGETAEPILKVQQPLSPALSQQHLVLPNGFTARLFASEPQIGKPLAIVWDARGRLWLAETVDYPNDLQPPGKGHDRIRICEDTDGDGRADKFTIFADSLSIPTSLAFAAGGLVVHQAPDTLLLVDTDGDDKADVRKVLFSGWGTRDTHAGVSNLRYGIDNWLYSIVGYSGFRGEVAGERHDFKQGLVRFKPDGSKLEFLRSTNNNSWGVGISEEGLLFGSTANGCPSVFMSIANRYYERVRGWSPSVLENIAPDDRFFPVAGKIRQVDFFGGFTAGAGHALYTARRYPRAYWNRAAFIAEPTGHLLATFNLVPRGSDFVAFYGWNLAASDDDWTAPIAADVGPDGNVWLIDWYNLIVQHNPTPPGFQTGRGNAYVTPLRDKTHGRIYRIAYGDDKHVPAPRRLSADDPQSLVATLKDDNMLWRLHAQRLLVERGKPDIAAELIALVRDKSVDAIGLNPAAIHALETLEGLGLLAGPHPGARAACVEALGHPSAGVRRVAVQCLPAKIAVREIVTAGLLKDADAQVRLAAFLALADAPPDSTAGPAVLAALGDAANAEDRWIPDAATSAAAAHDVSFLQAVELLKEEHAEAALQKVVERVAEHYARGAPSATIEAVIAPLGSCSPDIAGSIVSGLAKGWPQDKLPSVSTALEQGLLFAFTHLPSANKSQLASLAERWKSHALEQQAGDIARGLLERVRNAELAEADRLAAAQELMEFRKRDEEAAAALIAAIGPRTAPEVAAGMIRAIGKSEAKGTGATLVERWPSFTPSVRSRVQAALLARADWTAALLSGIERGTISLADLTLDQKQSLSNHPNKLLARRAKSLLEQGGGLPDADRQKVIAALAPTVLTGGDRERGKAVFKSQCAKCHLHSGEGNKVGPDLTGVAVHPKEQLLTEIIDPNRSVEGNFRVYSVVTADGIVLTGLLASESKTAIELLDAEAKRHTVLRENIEQLGASAKSLMPEGFEKEVPPQAIADLLEFLSARGKYLPLDLRKVATVISTQNMFFNKDEPGGRLVFSDWSPKTTAGVPFQLVDPEAERVPNVLLLHGPLGVTPPKMPKSATLAVNAPAKAIHLLSGVSGWGFYNGTPSRTVSLIVRLHYADDSTEDHELLDGIHFADYINYRIEVPESKLAFRLGDHQVRYLAIMPKRADAIRAIELRKGNDRTAPIIIAVTVEGRD